MHIKLKRLKQIFSLLVGALLLICTSACFLNLPHISVDQSHLGSGLIAETLGEIWMNDEDSISAILSQKIYLNRDPSNPLSKSSLEKMGAVCDLPPSALCKYQGELSYELFGRPKGNEGAQNKFNVSIDMGADPIQISTKKSTK
jgi:hypothetical protein